MVPWLWGVRGGGAVELSGVSPTAGVQASQTTPLKLPVSSSALRVLGLFCQRRLAFCHSWKQCKEKVSRSVFLFLLPWPVYIFGGILSSFPLFTFLSFFCSSLPPFLPFSFSPSLSFLPWPENLSVSKPKNDLIVIYAASQSDVTYCEWDFKGQKYLPFLPLPSLTLALRSFMALCWAA